MRSVMPTPSVSLRPWRSTDLHLLERLMGDPQMTEHLGGPETNEEIRSRHERYCAPRAAGSGRMLVIVGPNGEPAGSVGFWEKEWAGETVWETGWSVLPEFQGQGIATRAAALAVAEAARQSKHRSIHAFPAVGNSASNAICRKVGFTLRGAVDFEYHGHTLRCNDWAIQPGVGRVVRDEAKP
jgi:RimJ/RimL family protein N-acetyltransferase